MAHTSMLFIEQQFVITHRYTILHETQETLTDP